MGLPENLMIPNNIDENYSNMIKTSRDGWGTEFLEHMLGSFKNYIQKGNEYFLQGKDAFGISFIELLFSMIKRIYEIGKNGQSDGQMVCATSLYGAFIENNFKRIDKFIPIIIEDCYEHLVTMKKKTGAFNAINIGIVINCFFFLLNIFSFI